MDERRRFVRLPARLRATYQVVNSDPPRDSLIKNMGGGGIGFFTESRLAPGTVVQVEVQFPERPKPVRFTAQVVWSGELIHESRERLERPYEAGLRFLDVSPEDRQFVMQRSALGTPPHAPFGR